MRHSWHLSGVAGGWCSTLRHLRTCNLNLPRALSSVEARKTDRMFNPSVQVNVFHHCLISTASLIVCKCNNRKTSLKSQQRVEVRPTGGNRHRSTRCGEREFLFPIPVEVPACENFAAFNLLNCCCIPGGLVWIRIGQAPLIDRTTS